MIGGVMMRVLFFILLVPLAAAAAFHREEPLLFHVHRLSFSPDGSALLVPSHTGLAVYRDGSWTEEGELDRDFTGFAVTESAIYASGHPSTANRARRRPAVTRARLMQACIEADVTMRYAKGCNGD